MRKWDVQKICSLLLKCGKIALEHYENPSVFLKEDDTVVTAADREIESLLAASFDKPEAGCYMIGEETLHLRSEDYIQAALNAESCYIVDPIDGTMPYSVHIPMWGVSIAFASKGIIKHGAIYLPATGEMIISGPGECFIADKVNPQLEYGHVKLKKMTFPETKLNTAGVISVSQSLAKQANFTFNNQIVSISSCVGSMMWLFKGRFIAYAAMLKLWDIAGCLGVMSHSSFKTRVIGSKKELTLAIEDNFLLDPKSSRRWYIKDLTLIAANEQIIDFLQDNAVYNGEKQCL